MLVLPAEAADREKVAPPRRSSIALPVSSVICTPGTGQDGSRSPAVAANGRPAHRATRASRSIPSMTLAIQGGTGRSGWAFVQSVSRVMPPMGMQTLTRSSRAASQTARVPPMPIPITATRFGSTKGSLRICSRRYSSSRTTCDHRSGSPQAASPSSDSYRNEAIPRRARSCCKWGLERSSGPRAQHRRGGVRPASGETHLLGVFLSGPGPDAVDRRRLARASSHLGSDEKNSPARSLLAPIEIVPPEGVHCPRGRRRRVCADTSVGFRTDHSSFVLGTTNRDGPSAAARLANGINPRIV